MIDNQTFKDVFKVLDSKLRDRSPSQHHTCVTAISTGVRLPLHSGAIASSTLW